MNDSRLGAFVCTGLIAIVCGACGAGGTSDGWAGTVRDSAGITIVRNPAEGLWSAEERWTVREDLRIGTATGAAEYRFGMVWDVAVDDAGRIYVLDQRAQNVRVYDEEGEHLRTIGRPGQGPGELGPGLRWLMIGPGDTLYVPVNNQQRVQRYLLDGTPAGSFRTPLSQGVPIKWLIRPGGLLVTQLRSLALLGAEAAPDRNDVLVVRTGDGAIADTLVVLPRGQTSRFSGGMNFNFFAPEPIWTIGADGALITAMNSAYRIEIRSLAGELMRIISKRFERRPVTESDRRALDAMIRQMFRNQGVPPAAVDRINIQFADHYPAFSSILAGPAGTIWVQRIRSIESMGAQAAAGTFNVQDLGAPRWDVFDADGRYLGVVTLPDRFRPWTLTGDHIYGVWRDDLGVQYVLRLEIVRS